MNGQNNTFPETNDSTMIVPKIDMESFATIEDFEQELSIAVKKKHGLLWLWIVLAFLVVLGAAAGGGYWFFQSHALPGVKLWGHSMMGRTQQQIADEISQKASEIEVPVSYNGTTTKISLQDLGISADSEAIAAEVYNAKRSDSLIDKYAFWNVEDITTEPFDVKAADAQTVGDMLGVQSTSAVDAGLKLNKDGTAFDVVSGQQGIGISVVKIAQEAERVLESLGGEETNTVVIEADQTDPDVTDEQAQQAKTVADALISKSIAINIGDHKVAEFNAAAIASAITVSEQRDNEKLADGQFRKGLLVIDGTKLQEYYETSIKTNFHADRVDGDVIVNSVGDVLQTNIEGHDGITVSNGGDTSVGSDAAKALAQGGESVTIQGTCDQQNEKKTTRTVVVSLSGHTVSAIENGQVVRVMHMSAGQGNDYQTGQCQPSGDLCTPTYCDPNTYDNCTPDGDFKVWLKYQSQNMSGNLTLSDGSSEQWDVKDVGFVNYFSKTGCAIHRIATQSAFNDSSIQAMASNTSHGCVGVGWDQAEWFYNWCLMGTTVHVQA